MTDQSGGGGKPPVGKFIEAAALLSHVQMLESKLPQDDSQFGHPQAPQLYMCRIPDPDRDGADLGVVTMMAVTKRCISAQLLKESVSFTGVGAPVEVLVMSGEDEISCAALMALEVPHLTAADTLIVPDRGQGQVDLDTPVLSLMSGGLVPVAPSPRVAVVAGTTSSRVVCIEFSVRPNSMQLVRRNYFSGKKVGTYFEPLPHDHLTELQKRQRHAAPVKKSTRTAADPTRLDNREVAAILPFEPSGGVTTILPYTVIKEGKYVTVFWISFGDGTSVRLHHAGFFASVIQKQTENQAFQKQTESEEYEPSLEVVLNDRPIRWRAQLPPLDGSTVVVNPIPKYHPSPLAPFPAWKRPEFDESGTNLVAPDSSHDELREIFEAVVYCPGAMPEVFPTLAFYTSEDQFEGRIQGDPEADTHLDDSHSSLTNMLGGFFGIFGGTAPKPEDGHSETPSRNESEPWDPNIPFPSINVEPIRLFAGYEIHDPPRQVTFCTIDPEGDLAAIADTLGRVCLIDLSTKQIIRMWKGYRDTLCYWIQVPKNMRASQSGKDKLLYLVMHCRQRKVLEVWRTRHGPKVKSMQVNREAQVLTCREISPMGPLSSCYLAHSNVPFSSMNQIERIHVREDDTSDKIEAERTRQTRRPVTSRLTHDAAARLNRLQQLLDETNVECQSVDVFKALENIKSVQDLATALDLLAIAPALEGKMGVEGSEFQRLAVSHCKTKLDEAISGGGKEAMGNQHVQLLAFKIAYYTQIVNAYDILHKYEKSADEEENPSKVVAPTQWGLEAVGWTSTFEKISKRSIDDETTDPPSEPLQFYEFASACVPPKKWREARFDIERGGYTVFLSDSSKTRRDLLIRIFRPLLGDVFSFNVVNQIFESLGIKTDYEYLLKCFGEWFMAQSVKDASKKALFAEDSPTNRWLQEIVGNQIDAIAGDGESDKAPMESLHQYCRESENLVKVFWLGSLCHQAISRAAASKEDKTYGKVSKDSIVNRWDQLLRQLRVCLLVSLRLYGIPLGACPLSIKAVEKDDNFSVFEWLANDEILTSHKQDEIVSLENACRISSRAFDPSTAAGDDPARVKLLQKSCLVSAVSESERAEQALKVDNDDDEQLGALLLYMKPHNIPGLLVPHRALLLASKWGRMPERLEVLQDSINALKAVDMDEYKRIASAVRLEVWQSRIRPIFRALLVGFHDVQEISQEIVAPLLGSEEWLFTFSELASTVLDLILDVKWHESERVDLFDPIAEEDDTTWPPVRDCFLLQRLVLKNRRLSPSSLDAHRIFVTALRVSKDMATLSQCVPAFYDLFTPVALFNRATASEDIEEKQHAFMQDAIVEYAREYAGPSLDSLYLGDIETLADLWDFDMDNVRTLFLLSMYEYGKDKVVDELVTKSASIISVQHFCEDGVEIVCRRLNHLLNVNPTDDIKRIMGTLDADMCEWIREKAENSEPLINGRLDVQVGNTHLFGLRLLSLAASTQIAKEDRIKIHSLIVLSGMIVKALEETAGNTIDNEAEEGGSNNNDGGGGDGD